MGKPTTQAPAGVSFSYNLFRRLKEGAGSRTFLRTAELQLMDPLSVLETSGSQLTFVMQPLKGTASKSQ